MFNDDEFEIIEDDLLEKTSASPSNSNYENFSSNQKNSDNLKNTIEKNKQNINNNKNVNNNIDNGNQFKKAGNVANMSKGVSSNNPEEQAHALKNMGKETIRPIVRKGVQAATGGVIGTDPITGKIIDKTVDKVADNPNVDKIVNNVVEQVTKVKRAKNVMMAAKFLLPIIGGALPVIFLVMIISYLFMPVFGLEDYDGKKNKHEVSYYEELDNISTIYSNKCGTNMNTDIISTTIFYDQMFYNIGKDIDYSEDGIGFDESAFPKINYKNKDDDIKKLAKVLYPNFDFDEQSEESEEDEEEPLDIVCGADYVSYKSYIVSNYMRNNYKNLKLGTNYNNIAEEILAMSGQFIIQNAYKGATYCQGITVVDREDNLVGTYDLETYVAGVLAGETYLSEGIEALKAQAIAARTYALKRTDNCKASIVTGDVAQVFKETTNEKAIQAAQETEGLVLKYNDEIFSAMYDSFCYEDKDCPDSYCDENGCTVTYNKVPNGETHTVSISSKWKNYLVPGGGHAQGMSQLAAYQMAEEGSSYEDILYTFYSSGVEISKMSGLIQGNTYTSSVEPPINANAIKERVQTGSDMFYNSSKGLISQCPWYAKSRASEILYYSNIPEDVKNAAIISISNTSGDGGYVVNNVDESIFLKSYDYTQPHPGSLVSWTSTASEGPNCHNYGHVAIVEQVNEDGSVVISEGWNSAGADGSNVWSNIAYSLRNVSLGYIAEHKNSSGCTYTFAGYVYLLG